jgi:uncharacterized membrane protein
MIAAHNATDGVRADTFGAFAPAWNVLHQPGVFLIGETVFFVAYPLVPWIAVMAAGYCFGRVFLMESADRQKWMLGAGALLTAAFVVLRGLNIYGDPQPWSAEIPGTALLSFLRTTKYPPSLLFLLMTLGPALLILGWFDRRPPRSGHPLVILGRVPLFFFLLHFSIAHALAFPFAFVRYGEAAFLLKPMPSLGGDLDSYPPGFGYNLSEVYLLWLVVLALSYPVCRWFAGVKERRSEWWLSYL